jgi:cytochrome c-type biogenesis protein CcmH/NrfG
MAEKVGQNEFVKHLGKRILQNPNRAETLQFLGKISLIIFPLFRVFPIFPGA